MMLLGFIFLACLLTVLCDGLDLRTLRGNDTYSEELLIKRLKTEHLLKQFRFVITADSKPGSDYALFPRIISEVVTKHYIREFHLSLTQGFWMSNEWGVPPQPASPSGAQLYAWIEGNKTDEVDERWTNFVNSINGIFCTSLLDMLPNYVAVPRISFLPVGYVKYLQSSSHLRFGALSGETVCTENFTPWRKLLPCKQTGLSTLLNPIKLYESVFQSMSVHFLHVCKDGTASCGSRRRLELNLNFVSEIDLKWRKLDWSFWEIFGRRIDRKCVMADRDIVMFENDRMAMTDGGQLMTFDNRTFTLYNITAYPPQAFPIDIGAKYGRKLKLPAGDKSPTLVTIRSYVAGTDQQSGRLMNVLRNGQSIPQRITYTHIVPWFIRIYYHTILFKCNIQTDDQDLYVDGKINEKVFVPAKDRQRPFLLEWDVTLPALSVCEFSFEFDKAFLRVNEYPPDANHGFYIPAAVITFTAATDLWYRNRTALGDSLITGYDELLGRESSRVVRMYGEPLLILLPVPDFSMPFNVICLVCTAIAMLFGPVHALTTKMMIPLKEEDKDLAPVPPLRRLILFIHETIIQRVLERLNYYTKFRQIFGSRKEKMS